MDATPEQPMLFNDPATEKTESLHDSARGTPEPLDEFHALVEDINGILGPSNGIDSADVDVEEIKNVMLAYQSNEQEWSKYAFADSSRAYTRNLVDRGNGKSNLLILVWTPGKASPIHDHANAHCIMKILRGSLTETIYGWPCQDSENPAECATAADSLYPSTKHTCQARGSATGPSELHVRKETTYEREQVTYMSDSLGLHRICNPSESEYAISLHLYTPPNAAKFGCNIYDRKTGKSSHASQCHFYSELGQKME